MKAAVVLTAFLCLAGVTGMRSQQAPPPQPILSGVFTDEQAKRGKVLYDSRCAVCHGDKLVAEDPQAADLTGFTFHLDWHGKTVAERLEKIRSTMPPGAARMLSDQEYLDVIAYILGVNGYPAGKTELTPNVDALRQITIVPSGKDKDQ